MNTSHEPCRGLRAAYQAAPCLSFLSISHINSVQLSLYTSSPYCMLNYQMSHYHKPESPSTVSRMVDSSQHHVQLWHLSPRSHIWLQQLSSHFTLVRILFGPVSFLTMGPALAQRHQWAQPPPSFPRLQTSLPLLLQRASKAAPSAALSLQFSPAVVL